MNPVKVTVNLSKEVIGAIEEMAEVGGHTRTEIIRRSVSTQKWVMDEIKKGNKILIEDKEGRIREVVFQ